MALSLQLLLLLVIANGAPVLARLLLAERLAAPVDGNRIFRDGRPLLGPRKTWRGLLAALLATTLVALMLGMSSWLGLLLALGAMAGDLLSSFTKRRLGIGPHRSAPGLDQGPESLLPLLLIQPYLPLAVMHMAAIVIAFSLVELLLTRMLTKAGDSAE